MIGNVLKVSVQLVKLSLFHSSHLCCIILLYNFPISGQMWLLGHEIRTNHKVFYVLNYNCFEDFFVLVWMYKWNGIL